MNVLDLFSGIGGFSLGLERAGMRTVAFCESDPFCRAILAQHWPAVPCWPDVREVRAARLRASGIEPIDVICGGFPCQDISQAGLGAGIGGARSGLWSEYARLIGEIRPRYAIVENVAALASRGLERVLGDLAEIGYDAEWHCIPASAVGAPHRRDRFWIVAYPNGECLRYEGPRSPEGPQTEGGGAPREQRLWPHAESGSEDVADADSQGQPQQGRPVLEIWRWLGDGGEEIPDPECHGLQGINEGGAAARSVDRPRNGCDPGWWSSEPDVGRVADGVPARVDRLRGLGNAVVPKIPEIIGRAIMMRALTSSDRTPETP